MQPELFALGPTASPIQPLVIDCSPAEFFTRAFGISPGEAVDRALWSAKFSGTLAGRQALAAALEDHLVRQVRTDEMFAATLSAGPDPIANVGAALGRWIRERTTQNRVTPPAPSEPIGPA